MLSDEAIRYSRHNAFLDIEPWSEEAVNPASYDVHLGRQFQIYNGRGGVIDPYHDVSGYFDPVEADALDLHPGVFALATTVETVTLSRKIAASVSGKSSLARLGLEIHAAGWCDPAFSGRITLELVAAVPIRLHAGMPIAQLCFVEIPGGSTKPYAGRYQGQDGPQISRYGVGRAKPINV